MALTIARLSDPTPGDDLRARGRNTQPEAAIGFDQWLDVKAGPAARGTDGEVAAAGTAVADTAPASRHADVNRTNAFLLGLQEAEPAAGAATGVETYNFSDMTRGEISDVGKKLFNEGKISLDELFRFEHPDGRLKIGVNGEPVALNPYDRIDFIGFTRKAVRDMEETGEALRPDSGYKMFVDLLAKLQAWQG